MTFEEPDYKPRFLFTEPPAGYGPAIAWARRQRAVTGAGCHGRRGVRWGAWLRRVHLARLAEQREERRNALARLAATAEQHGTLAPSLVRYARRSG
jgi:hypothetical protein